MEGGDSAPGKAAGVMWNYLTTAMSSDKKKCEFVLKHWEEKPKGHHHAQDVATQFQRTMTEAGANKDWEGASTSKKAKDNWQKIADQEKSMQSKCMWAIGHAQEKLQYHQKREEFDKCKYYQSVLDAATAYSATIPVADKMVCAKPCCSSAPSRSSAKAPPRSSVNVGLVEEDINGEGGEDTDDEGHGEDSEDEEGEDNDEGGEDSNDEGGEEEAFNGAKKSNNSRKRKLRRNAYKPKNAGKAKKKKVQMEKPPNESQYQKFVRNKSCKVPFKDERVDVSEEMYTRECGYLFCEACFARISWNNRKFHIGSAKHNMKKKEKLAKTKDAESGAKKAQKRIVKFNLVGKLYSDIRLSDSIHWLRALCKGNVSLGSFDAMRSYLSMVSKNEVPNKNELSERLTDLKAVHKVRMYCVIYPHYTCF